MIDIFRGMITRIMLEMSKGHFYNYTCDKSGCDRCRLRFLCFTTRKPVKVPLSVIEKQTKSHIFVTDNFQRELGRILEEYLLSE